MRLNYFILFREGSKLQFYKKGVSVSTSFRNRNKTKSIITALL